MSYTLANLATFATQHGYVGTTAAAATQLDAWINDMIQRLASARDWPCYQKPYYLSLAAPYTDGTVHLTNGSTTVTATGTTFVSGMVGQEFWTGEDGGRVYQVASLTGTTEIELESKYLGSNRLSTASGAPVKDNGTSTVTAAAAMFLATDVGKELTFNATGNSYTIASYTSSTIVVVTGDASGEADGDSMYVEVSYAIRYVRVTLAADWDRPTGAMWLGTGTEISYETVSLNDWQGLRLRNRGTTSVPTHIAYDKGGPGQDSQHYVYVHPAPSAARILRGTYQVVPVTATSLVDPDWPTKYLYLLHKLLRMELSTQDAKGGYAIESVEMQAMIEEAFQRDVQHRGPYRIRVGRGRGVIDDAHALLSRIVIRGDRDS